MVEVELPGAITGQKVSLGETQVEAGVLHVTSTQHSYKAGRHRLNLRA